MNKTINIMMGHADYKVNPRIGPEILYHGQTIDLRSITVKKADEIASDPEHRYLTFTTERVATGAASKTAKKKDEKAK